MTISQDQMNEIASEISLQGRMMMVQAGGDPMDHLTMVTAIFLKSACAFAVMRGWDEPRTLKRAMEMVQQHIPTAYKEVKDDYDKMMLRQSGESEH